MAIREEFLEKILSELEEIKQILLLNARDSLKNVLNEIATTKERKQIWGLMDGFTSTTEISEKVRVSSRTVQIFISQLESKQLVIIEKRGYPKRRVDFIPSDWKLKEVSRLE